MTIVFKLVYNVGVVNTYGRKYDTTENTITLEANISQDVPLGSNGPSNGITPVSYTHLDVYKRQYISSLSNYK